MDFIVDGDGFDVPVYLFGPGNFPLAACVISVTVVPYLPFFLLLNHGRVTNPVFVANMRAYV